MNAKEYQDMTPRLLTQKQAEQYTGLGRAALTDFGNQIGARRKFGKKVLYDKKAIDAALDAMGTAPQERGIS